MQDDGGMCNSNSCANVDLSISQFALLVRVYNCIHLHGKYVYSTLALGKEREIVKEETALRKENTCLYVHLPIQYCTCIVCTHFHVHIQHLV